MVKLRDGPQNYRIFHVAFLELLAAVDQSRRLLLAQLAVAMGSSMLEISGGLALVWCIVLLVEVFVKYVAPYSWAPSESARVNFVRTHEVRVQLKKVRRFNQGSSANAPFKLRHLV